MSSNKIGFLTALGIYAPIILGLALLDLRVNLVGESGESKAFSIRLENIAGDFGGAKNAPKKVAKKVPKKVLKKQQNRHSNISQKGEKSKPLESSVDSNTDSQDSRESNADTNDSNNPNDSSDSRGGVASKAQEASGENDSYFLAITRIINKYHTREPIRNLYGIVGVAFSINVSGEVEHLRVISSSGNEKLDSVALRTIRRAARSFPPPKRTYHIQTKLVYKRS